MPFRFTKPLIEEEATLCDLHLYAIEGDPQAVAAVIMAKIGEYR